MTLNAFLENFETIANAPGGIPRLRELIINLGVRGKLVKQIASEGRQAIEPTSPGLFEVPDTWSWLHFSDFVDFKVGKTPPTKEKSFWGDARSTMWVSITDMVNGGIVLTSSRTVTLKSETEVFRYKPWPAGTMLMSFKLTIGKVARLGQPGYFNEAIFSFSSGIEATDEYLFRLLPLLSQSANSKGAIKGNTLNSESISNILIPLPPEKEQIRISAKIDELMAICDELEAAQSKRDLIRESIAKTLTRILVE
jgi:type I restriction enzyme, S subunit